jgi:hypothetical protein
VVFTCMHTTMDTTVVSKQAILLQRSKLPLSQQLQSPVLPPTAVYKLRSTY